MERLYRRVLAELGFSQTGLEVCVRFRQYAGARSVIRLRQGRVEVSISDVLSGAPHGVMEALAYILICRLFRQPVPEAYWTRYRRHLNRSAVQRDLDRIRRVRGRKTGTGPTGRWYDLDQIFEDLNTRFFQGLMARPQLTWSVREARRVVGHYDPIHNTIVISRVLDREDVPRWVVEYVLYHEMLHLQHPVERVNGKTRIHTHAFRAAEREFPAYQDARQWLLRHGRATAV